MENFVNNVKIANIVDCDAMKYKTQYNNSLQVRVTRQTNSSIESDNFSAMYLSKGDSLNANFFFTFYLMICD